jgi:hypothetical protein
MASSTYRAKRTGRLKVSRQTELLACYYEVFAARWLGLAEAAIKLSHLTRHPIAPNYAVEAQKKLAKVLDPSGGRTH